MNVDTAVVLAAGEGKRLRPLTKNRPKPMLPVANRPILEYVLDELVDAGLRELHLVVGYKRDRVREYFGSTYREAPITYHIQHKQLGSGHALLQARSGIDSDFLVVNGDQLVSREIIADVLDAHTVEDVATLGVMESERIAQYGAVTLSNDHVTQITERPQPDTHGLLNAGVYVFAPSVFAEIEAIPRQQGELSLPGAIEALIEAGKPVRGVRTVGFWRDATFPWDLLSLSEELLAHGHVTDADTERDIPTSESSDGHSRTTTVAIDDEAQIHETAVVRAPVVIGADCSVGANAVVGPNVALGRNGAVEAGAAIRNSVIDQDSRIEMNATLIDAVTGQAVVIGPGTIIPGGRSDIPVGERVYQNERLGAVVGDRAELEGGCTVDAGTLIGPNVRAAVGCSIMKNRQSTAGHRARGRLPAVRSRTGRRSAVNRRCRALFSDPGSAACYETIHW